MKKGWYVYLALIVWACSGETRENPPIPGYSFTQGNPWEFHFIDGADRDLLSIETGAKLPVSTLELPASPYIIPEGYIEGLGNYFGGLSNQARFDERVGYVAWTTSLPGIVWIPETEFYIVFDKLDADTIRVVRTFDTEGCVGGDVCPEIQQVYYNGIQIVKDRICVTGSEHIFIRKQDGQTSLAVRPVFDDRFTD